METSYTCLTCSAISSTSGWFTDLHLAIPSTSPEASTSKDPVPAPSTSPLTVPSLLKDYLTPERLEGENQYQCDTCRCKRDIGVGDLKLKPFFRCKRDAEKKVLLTSAPAHLNITLLSYENQLEFGLTACRRTLPSMQRLLDFIENGIHELEVAADIQGK